MKDKIVCLIISMIYVFIADTVVDIMAVSNNFIINLLAIAYIMFILYIPSIIIYNKVKSR